MLTQPLTHHAILTLIEPFTRSGRQIDLAASDRLERRLIFKSVDHAVDGEGQPSVSEQLQLHNPETGLYRLTRINTWRGQHISRISVEGPEPSSLLASLSKIDPHQGLVSGDGYVMAKSYRLNPAGRLELTTASALISDLALSFEASTVRGYPAEYDLKSNTGHHIDLPDDALALLGRPWSLLDRSKDGWRGRIKMRGREPALTQLGEDRLTKTVTHLAALLNQRPSDYHETYSRQRWRVFARRALPIIAIIGLFAVTAALAKIRFPPGSPWQMLLFNLPPLLMIAAFSLRELPRIEIPPIPRPLKLDAWQQPSLNP